MKTLVTGATGLVGGATVDELLKQGHAVRALVRDPLNATDLAQRGVEVIAGDICKPATLTAAVRDVDVVYHCAAAVGAHFTKQEIYAVNYDGVRNLLEAVRQAGKGRVVLLSSVNVLGTRNLDPATEDTSYQRSNDPAADVKIDAEQLALTYHREHNIDVVIIRPGFIYGIRDKHNVPKLVSAIQRGKFRFIGSKDTIIPIVHVNDVVQALLAAGATPAASGRIYNITDGGRTTIGELATHLAELLGCPPPQKVLLYAIPYTACVVFEWLRRLHIRNKPGPINRASLRFLAASRYIDIRRAREELGYAPQVNLREGMAEVIKNLKAH